MKVAGSSPARLMLALLLATGAARAEEAPPTWDPGERTTGTLATEVTARDESFSGDGVYGRYDGSFDLGLSAGPELGKGGLSGNARASLHYFSMAGAYVEYVDALGADRPTERLVAAGVDLRPAFVPRWSKGYEKGPGILDLTIDSFSIGLGAYFRSPRGGSFGDARGLELSLGLGVPLTKRSTGPWVRTRAILRWDEPSARALASAFAALGWDFVL